MCERQGVLELWLQMIMLYYNTVGGGVWIVLVVIVVNDRLDGVGRNGVR